MITTENKSINFIKKEDLTGSYEGMRYVMHHLEETFETWVWPEPFCFEKTPREKKKVKEFPLTVEGRDEAVRWLNEQYEEGKSEWQKAKASFYRAMVGK